MAVITEMPVDKAPTVGMFPAYYDALYDEVSIPLLPSDPDTAASILGSWAQLLIDYKILTPEEAEEVVRKAGGKFNYERMLL